MRSHARVGGIDRSGAGTMQRRPRLILAVVFMLLASPIAPVAAAPGGTPEIMFVGDSITYGTDSTGTVGFRRPLYQSLLVTHGSGSFDFVGSQAHGTPDDFDRDHEGHSGWEADEIESNIIGWLNTNPADIVALHIGTNDITAGDSVAAIAGDIDDILDNIDTWEASNHSVWVVLARIINRSNPTDTLGLRTTELNEAIQILADARIALGDQIVVVDMEPALNYPADLDDSVHPNDSGYGKMAAVYDPAIDALLTADSGPLVENVVLSSSPAGGGVDTDDLSCAFDLTGSTSATVWSLDGSPLATLALPMEGGASAALLDYSGNGNDVAPYDDPVWSATAGHDGNGAFVFDGGDDLHAEGVFPVGSSYTKTAWVYRTGSGNSGGNNIISGDANGGGHALWARDSYGNKLSAGHNGTWNSVIDSEALALNTWFHVALTWDSATGLMSLYKNGALVSGSGAIPTATVTAPVTDATVSIGSFGSAGHSWVGTIDDATVYPVALSGDQIASLYANGDSNTMVAAETTPGDEWQCQVTPFSDSEAGTTEASNTLTITGAGPDVTDPLVTITTPADGATYDLDEVVVADFECTDTESGIASCVGDVADGSPIDTSTLGAHTFTVVGTDNATNTTTVVHDYTVADVVVPLVENVVLSSSPAGGGADTDDLSCAFDLTGLTSATVWSVDGSPLATLALPMEGGATASLLDYSGNGNDASTAGDPVWSATGGHDGNGAFVFDGNDYLDPGGVFPVGGSSYTKTAWVYRTGSGYINIMSSDSQADSSGNPEHVFWAPGGSSQLAAGHGSNRYVVQDPDGLAADTWYHVAVTWDAATGDMVLYKNGVVVDTGNTSTVVTQTAVQVGGFAGSYGWVGSIDDARLYPVALSGDQIASMYSAGDDTIVAAETAAGEDWQCQVTPFSDTEAGTTVASNTLAITTGPDTTDPVVTITSPLDGAEFDLDESVTVAYECTDPGGSGIASCVGDVADGGSLDTSTLGAHTFTVVGTDNATNETTVVHDYTVVDVVVPLVENVVLSSSPAGGGVDTDDLLCAFDLTASTSATVWTVDTTPTARFAFPMEGGASDALADLSGNGNDATANGATWSATAGHDGHGAFVFDGSNDYLAVGEVFPTGSSYTKTAWVYRTADGGNNIMSGNTGGGGHAFWARDSNGSKLSSGHDGSWQAVMDSEALALNTWFHVAVTWESSTGLMTLYKNGAVVDSATVSDPVTDLTVNVGSYGSGYLWNGTIDDARLYTVALSGDQIASMYSAGDDTIVAAETAAGEDWQCQVTPFSDTEAGTTVASNTLAITAGPDTTDPVVTITSPLDGAEFDLDESVTVAYECTDPGGSGIASCVGDVADGGSLDTSTLGAHTFTVVGTDNATNETTVVHDYTVVDVVVPLVENVVLSSSPAGGGVDTDDLLCAFDLTASTSATAWSVDGTPRATLVLPMEGGAAASLLDYSGNGNDTTAMGNPVWSATGGHDGNGAYEFDGSGDYLDAGAVFPVGSSYTKTAWVYRTDTGNINIMSSDAQGTGDPEHVFWAPGGSSQLAAGHGSNRYVVQDPDGLAADTWYHVAVTWDLATGDMVLYKNGVEVDTGNTSTVVNQAAVQVGGFDEIYVWEGSIDDARLYPVVLSADQIASMYSAGDDTIVAAETAAGEDWQCQVTPFSDAADGTTVASNTLTIIPPPDTTDPVVTITSPADGGTFELNEVVAAAYECTDPGGSGVASCVGDVADGASLDTSTLGAHTFTVVGTDNATNETTVVHDYTVVDTTDPVVTITSPVDGAEFVQDESVTVAYECTDPGGSGVASCVGDVADGASLDTSTLGAHTFTVVGTDNATNETTVVHGYTVVVVPDTTDPVVTITSPADGATFELDEVVAAAYECTDPGGSGVASCVGDVADGASLDTSTLGAHTFTVVGTDNATNETTVVHDYTVVDTTDPVVTITSPVDGAEFVQDESVTVAYECTDPGGSGVASCVGDVADGASLDTSTLGAHTFTVVGTDNATNETTVVHGYTVVVVPDTTDPVVTITSPADGATFELDEVVAAAYECTDPGGSGVASCVGDVADGASLDTSTLGAHTFTVVGTDNATNETTVVHDYTVVESGGTQEIMLLGDSITDGGWGSSDDTGFRRFLYLSLEATHGAAAFDFVGSQTSGDPTDFDRNHEGHGGYDAHEIRDNVIGWLNLNPPDIVALHIGTNDINGGQSAAGVAAEISEILDNIDTWESTNQPVRVILARIINRSNPADTKGLETTALNEAIQILADARIAAGDLIYVVDMESALDYPGDMADTLHPNDSGYVKMAAVYDPAIDALLGAGPTVVNVMLSSSSGSNLSSDDLSCAFNLAGTATVGATVWTVNASPFATLALPMEGGASSALEDVSGNSNDATAIGDAAWSASGGHDGNGAFVFDGDGDYLDAGDIFPVGSSYTKTAWVYRAAGGSTPHLNIMSSDSQGDAGNPEHVLWAPEGYDFQLAAGHGGNRQVVKDPVPLAVDTWYHVAVTWDVATGDMVLYKNGAVVDTGNTTTGVTQTAVQIGAFANVYVWNGSIDDARLYPEALSADQIASLYATGDATIVAAETADGEAWQCQVTPFSDTEVGPTVASNTVPVGPVGPDLTDPEVTITTPVDGATYGQGTVVAASYGCTDAGGSGLASCVGDVADGAPIDTSTLGLKTFTVIGTDNASNTTTVTHNYTVEVYTGPFVENVALSSSSGSNLSSDDLSCAFDLAGSATTAATVWSVDASPWATLALPMEGGATAALEDMSGNNNDLAPYGSPVWSATAGHDGNGAFVFDGTDDLHAEGVFPVGSSYTKSAWVYRTGSGANGGNNIITGNTNTGGHALWARESNGFMLSAGHNGSWKSVIDSEALALNTWYHVAVTWDSSTGLMSLYKNGVLVNGPGAIPTATVTIPVTDDTVNIGSFGSANWSWVGTIDDPRVYPEALSADQIASLYATGDATIVAAETAEGEAWQCQVTPFSSLEAGTAVASNTLTIGSGPAATGMLRVVSSPAVPTQILVDGVPMDSWGLQWVKVPVGSHVVSFTDVQGFTTPAAETVVVSEGVTTEVTGVFEQRGWLQVSTSPAVPSTITVDGVAMNDWGVWTDLPAGSYEVCYGDVADFATPGCETVSVTAGATTPVTGVFTSDPGAVGPSGHGMLRVVTDPAVPTQILIDGLPADSWGLNWLKVAPGAHIVSFTDLEGFTTPADVPVTVVAGTTSVVTGSYVQRGTLQVSTSPAVPATILVDGLPRDDWGMWTDLAVGSYQVCYGEVAGFTAPACETVPVSAGATTPVTGVFTPEP